MAAPSFISLVKGAAADLANAAVGAVRIFVDLATGEPSYKDESGTVTSLKGAAGADGADGADAPAVTYQDHGNTGSTETINASTADIHRLVANAATVTLTLTGAPSAGTPGLIELWLEQDGSGGRDWVFPGSVDFGDAGEPDWTTRLGGTVDIVKLQTVDGGTAWIASIDGRAGPAGTNGTNGTNGAAGTTGGAVLVDYTFSTTTTDSDPGSGNLRLSNATQNAATVIRTDLVDAHGATRTTTLDELDDSTNTVKGHLRLFKTDDPTKFLLFTLSSIATPSGYRNLTVVNVDSSGSSPFSNGDPVTLAFTRAGDVGASGTASVGSDPIWDAAGDLAVGSGADTAVRLAKGSAGAVLAMLNGAIAWNAGTSFPGSPATNDRYYRTDLALEFFYDGTRWLTTTLYREPLAGPFDGFSTAIFNGWPFSSSIAAGTLSRQALWHSDFQPYFVNLYGATYVATTNTGSHYWIYTLKGGVTNTTYGTFNTSADSPDTHTGHKVAMNVAAGSTERDLVLGMTKVGTPGDLYGSVAAITYRLIGT